MIKVENLTKKYKEFTAVEGLSFEVKEGEIFGFLGPNGAGKTTTIKMLTSQIKPTFGRAYISGFDILKEDKRLKGNIGVVFEEPNLYERLSAKINLNFFAKLYGINSDTVERLLEKVGLKERKNDLVKNFSRGMKQKLLIARALISSPSVLFLDEPTAGLDPRSSQEIRRLILELSKGGKTIFLTTHYMEEAEDLCDKIAIINQGKIIALGTIPELKYLFKSKLKDIYGEKEIGLREIFIILTEKELTENNF
ncbi:MAG: ABC transporter ATP-binding protein [Armatimonadetes bacterium]|nr:ABC transporter ATP-binding protein [Armatimonadota bacterium]